jgi:hypothetical protein
MDINLNEILQFIHTRNLDICENILTFVFTAEESEIEKWHRETFICKGFKMQNKLVRNVCGFQDHGSGMYFCASDTLSAPFSLTL